MKIPFSRTMKLAFGFLFFKADGWELSYARKAMTVSEKGEWKRSYLPIDVAGLTVLDVGAGEGETAKFFLDHGATHVVCIEPDEKAFEVLKRNAKKKRHLTALKKRFDLRDLNLSHDFMKMDIEGYEESVLEVKLQKPSVIEVHGLQLRDRFQECGYRIGYPHGRTDPGSGDVCYAYWGV